ncbi:MAG: class I tRNA ligase family protein, partial [Candidatus Thorarchaeota archaeon]
MGHEMLLKEKRWKPQIEEEILELWTKEQLYTFKRDTKKPIFSVDTPPPYLSGPWHVGNSIH